MALRIEWHPDAIEDVRRIGVPDQKRIRKVLASVKTLDDARQRLVPYSGALKGFWKLRVGDYRLICQILERGDQTVLIIHVAHRSVIYGPRGVRTVREREQ